MDCRLPLSAALLAALVFFAGCTTTERAGIAVTIVGLELTEAEVGRDAAVLTLRLVNENVTPVPVESIACRIVLDGRQFGQARNDETFGLPARGTVTRPVTLVLRNPEQRQELLRLVDAGEISYRVETRVIVNWFGNRQTWASVSTGRVNLREAKRAAAAGAGD